MRRHTFWSLTALFVIGASFPTQARTINLFCEIPAAHAEGDGGNVNIPASTMDFAICEGCRAAARRADVDAYYAKNHIKPATWHITSTQYVADEYGANQNGVVVAHISWVVHRTNATLEYTYSLLHGATAVSTGQCRLSKPAI